MKATGMSGELLPLQLHTGGSPPRNFMYLYCQQGQTLGPKPAHPADLLIEHSDDHDLTLDPTEAG